MKRSIYLLATLGLLVAISLSQIGCSGYSGVAVAGPAYGGVAYDAVLRNLRSSFRSVVRVPLDALARGTHRRSDKFQRYLDPRGLPKKPLRGPSAAWRLAVRTCHPCPRRCLIKGCNAMQGKVGILPIKTHYSFFRCRRLARSFFISSRSNSCSKTFFRKSSAP